MKSLIAICFSILLCSIVHGQSAKPVEDKNIKVMPSSIELVSVTQSAEKCRDKKGITHVFRVVSETPIDIVRYLKTHDTWGPSQWLNQKKGDEFTDFTCVMSAPSKYFSRAAGSNAEFPKP